MNKNEEEERNGFQWPVIVKNPNAHANLDYYYGPYASLDDLDPKKGFPADLLVPGFTVGIQAEDGSVEEWWVQGEGKSATWARKQSDVEIPEGVMTFKGTISKDNLKTIESPAKGDVWCVAWKSGHATISVFYVWNGKDWTPFRGVSKTLTIKVPSAEEPIVYDGSESKVVDLTSFMQQSNLNQLKADIQTEASETYATKEEVGARPDWKNGDIALLGRDLSSSEVKFKAGADAQWAGTNIKIGASADTATLSSNGKQLNVSVREVALSRNGSSLYRANPLVLAVRLYWVDKEIRYVSKYNPFNLKLTFTYLGSRGCYQVTHKLLSSGVSKIFTLDGSPFIPADETERCDRNISYMPVGMAARGSWGNKGNGRRQQYVSFPVLTGDYMYLYTQDDDQGEDFDVCDILIYDFSTL